MSSFRDVHVQGSTALYTFGVASHVNQWEDETVVPVYG